MKIDMNAPIRTLEDQPMEDGQGVVTLRRVVQQAALATLDKDHALSAEEKVALFNLAVDARNDDVDWSPENVARMRARIGKAYGPAVVGPAFQLLDPKV